MLKEEFTPKEQMERSAKWVLGTVAVLLMLGMVMVYSAKTIKSARLGGDPFNPLFSHAVKVGIGIAAMLVMMRIDYRSLGRHYGKLLIITLVVLLLVLVPGIGARINGARRWFLLSGVMVQPSEFAKLVLIVVVSSVVVKAGENITLFFKGLVPPLIACVPVCALILVEPDFGTTVIAGCLTVTLMAIGGVSIRQLAMFVGGTAPLLILFTHMRLGHVGSRLSEFMNPAETGQAGFSLMAMASGGFLGTGLGGSFCKLNFLAECESDFIFSIIGEELGFWGASMVIALFAVLIYHGIRILLGIRNRFGFMLATGILLLLSAQALVNVAVVIGMAPTKGLPLPFISSGGSSLIALMMAVGLFLNIAGKPDLSSEKINDEFFEAKLFRIVTAFKS